MLLTRTDIGLVRRSQYMHPPVLMYARISASRGSTTEEIFGVTTDYTRTIITDDMSCPIDENTRITIEGATYCVVKIAKSLNHIMIAVKEVESNGI